MQQNHSYHEPDDEDKIQEVIECTSKEANLINYMTQTKINKKVKHRSWKKGKKNMTYMFFNTMPHNPNFFLVCFLVWQVSIVIIPCLFWCWNCKYENKRAPSACRIYWSYQWPKLEASDQQEVLIHKTTGSRSIAMSEGATRKFAK